MWIIVSFSNSSLIIGGPISLLSSSLLGTWMSTTSQVHNAIISSFVNSAKSLLYTVPHWVLKFLLGSNFSNGLLILCLLLFYTLSPLLSGPVVLYHIFSLQMYPLVVIVLVYLAFHVIYFSITSIAVFYFDNHPPFLAVTSATPSFISSQCIVFAFLISVFDTICMFIDLLSTGPNFLNCSSCLLMQQPKRYKSSSLCLL